MKLSDTITKAIDNAKAGLKKLLGQERVSQFNTDPDSKYACFFTCFFMYFRTIYGMERTFQQYKSACLAVGAIKPNFTIVDHTKMAVAAGQRNLTAKNTASKIREKIFELLLKNQPVPFSLNGAHYESIDGYEVTDSGEVLFHVDDPGGQGDTYASADDLTVFRFDKSGKRVYSRHPNGSKRVITRVYWFE